MIRSDKCYGFRHSFVQKLSKKNTDKIIAAKKLIFHNTAFFLVKIVLSTFHTLCFYVKSDSILLSTALSMGTAWAAFGSALRGWPIRYDDRVFDSVEALRPVGRCAQLVRANATLVTENNIWIRFWSNETYRYCQNADPIIAIGAFGF